MSDPKYGEPVEEPKPVDDVVGSARAGLADAEASRDAVTVDDWDAAYSGSGALPERTVSDSAADRDAADRDATGASDDARTAHATTDHTDDGAGSIAPAAAASGLATSGSATSGSATSGSATSDAWTSADRDRDASSAAAAPATRAYDDAQPHAGVVSPSEPVVAPETVAAPAASPQPIFVQAPEAPTPRGNRGAAGGIGLLAALVFAVVYLGAALGLGALRGEVTVDNIGTTALEAVTSWWLWVPVAVFFLSFWILGAVINRGRWGLWVILGLLVGILSYAGHILGQLFQAPFWNIAPSEALRLAADQAFVPLALVALVAGRELTIWFGAWVSARGKRVTELNLEAQREYERTLEAGPQLHRY